MRAVVAALITICAACSGKASQNAPDAAPVTPATAAGPADAAAPAAGGASDVDCERAMANVKRLNPSAWTGDAEDLYDCKQLPRETVLCMVKAVDLDGLHACGGGAAPEGAEGIEPEPLASKEECMKAVAVMQKLDPKPGKEGAQRSARCSMDLAGGMEKSVAECVVAAKTKAELEACGAE